MKAVVMAVLKDFPKFAKVLSGKPGCSKTVVVHYRLDKIVPWVADRLLVMRGI